MNRLQIYRVLYRHNKLRGKRSPVYGQNMVSKIIIRLLSAFTILYLVFLAIIFSLFANDSSWIEGYEMMFALLPFILVIDFLLRFVSQQTPTQLVHPYLLLPMPKDTCIESFVLFSVFSSGNLVWLGLFIPFAIMSVLFQIGLFSTILFLLSLQLFIILNSLWYMLCRTLINSHIFWWILPVFVYSLVFMPWILEDFGSLCEIYANGGNLFTGNFLAWIGLFCMIALLVYVNIKVQGYFIYKEVLGLEARQLKSVSEFKFLNRFGEAGEYLKIELKSIMRNKNVRTSFIMSVALTFMLSIIITFTDICSDSFSKKYWLVYVFVLYGACTLIRVMSYEGNYIDGLMVHKENILVLLRAKYYLYIALLALPMLLMIPTLFNGKYSILNLVSIATFTAGPCFCLLMQMAVYNRQKTPLNTKITGKGSTDTNWLSIVFVLIVMFVPVAFINILSLLFIDTVTYIVLFVVGLLFVIFHETWLRNIYKRFMARRYLNMESFRA